MPNSEGKTSVFGIDGLSELEIRQIPVLNNIHTRNNAHPYPYGRAEINSIHIEQNNLVIDFNNNPSRHADIFNWPNDKDAKLSIAQKLASIAELKLHQ